VIYGPQQYDGLDLILAIAPQKRVNTALPVNLSSCMGTPLWCGNILFNLDIRKSCSNL